MHVQPSRLHVHKGNMRSLTLLDGVRIPFSGVITLAA